MPRARGAIQDELTKKLRKWLARELKVRKLQPIPKTTKASIWDRMSGVDSKTVMRSSPVFKEVLGIDLDPRLVRAGGYKNEDDVINDLVPKMMEKAVREGVVLP